MGSHAALPITNTLTMILTKQTAATHLSDSHLLAASIHLALRFCTCLSQRHSSNEAEAFTFPFGVISLDDWDIRPACLLARIGADLSIYGWSSE
jgi:hypothetical protein